MRQAYYLLSLGSVFVFAAMFLGCDRKPERSRLTGDYYIKLINFRVFDWPDSALAALENELRTAPSDSIDSSEKFFLDYIQFLKTNGLLKKPFVLVRQDDGSVKTLFLAQSDYDTIRGLAKDLQENGLKITIDAEVRELIADSVTLYEAIGKVNVTKLPGKTYWKK